MTPEQVSFNILSPDAGQQMYPGMIIQYTIAPLLGIPMHWITEITQIKAHEFFIDDQRVGPYALWHHQHHFKAVEGGTLMIDILHYQVPFGTLGQYRQCPLCRTHGRRDLQLPGGSRETRLWTNRLTAAQEPGRQQTHY
jgi:ligand-binding SRPBCC domain-containing protein